MPLVEKTGFFPDYYLHLKNSQSKIFDEHVAKITACHNDYDRVALVEQFPGVRERDGLLQVKRVFAGKNADTAAQLKAMGNEAFKAKDWFEAMLFYTRSYIALPGDNINERAIILANRSAALFHLEKYDETLIDVKRSKESGYPKDLIYKLYERQARCYLVKKDFPNAIASFKKCITALDDAKMPADRRSKMNLDSMTMVKMLERDPQTVQQAERLKKLGEVKLTMAIPDEKEFLSGVVRIDQSFSEGRFARAATDISVGEEILVEKPFVAVLLEKFYETHCDNCFIRTAIPVACPNCADVIYCSEECLSKAGSTYHQYECGILSTIWHSGASINCHMALRIIAKKPLQYFLNIKNDIDKVLSIGEILKLPKDDYRRVSHLERHEKTRTPSNFLQHTLMARFLTNCLAEAGYFGDSPRSADLITIGGILLRTLQFIQFNTHEVAELNTQKAGGNEKTLFIGGGLYPTLALFNHSCDPGVVRYFRGTTIHVNTVRPIEAGLQIAENYGPIYTQESREKRQAQLKELYWFDCTCDPCLENWPTFDRLPTDVIRFRCDGPKPCRAIIEVPATCNDFMIKCVTCGESTNILKGLKVMQDTELMTRTANRLYDAGNYVKALNKFIDLLKIMNEVLAPPFPDYCQCQQHTRNCFLHLGNCYNLN